MSDVIVLLPLEIRGGNGLIWINTNKTIYLFIILEEKEKCVGGTENVTL